MGGATLDVLVLGPTEVRGAAGPIALPRPSERALAVRLALARGAPVRDEVLARALWGDVELARPAERLRVLASRLRAALGPAAEALQRDPAGYRLDAVPADLARVEAALVAAQAARAAGDVRGAREIAAAATAQWRGPALADLRNVPFAAVAADRIDDLHVELRLALLSADVELGAIATARVELEQLVDEHPLHEPAVCLLAVALYRQGRQADALQRLARLKAALADELGIDPAPETTATELMILRQEAAAPSGPTASPLPVPGGTFVGRDSECRALMEELAAPGLITLTGTPGSGKTRLALEIARRSHGGRTVTWLDLAPLRERGAVQPALAAAAGVEAGPDDPMPRIAAAMAGGLLVIDNAEHLVDAVADLVTALRRSAPRLSVLVTSQRPLLLAGEELHLVRPLPPTAAAQLFCELAKVVRDERVDAICAAVDHLPLGVELAAGLTRTLTVPQIAARVDDRLRLLVAGTRDAGARHTSLRAALDWSYRLLDDCSATVLRRLPVFAGGCTLDAAEEVLPGGDLARSDIAAALTDLHDRNLVTASRHGSEPRFVLLESVHAFASEQLAADAAERDAALARHLAWCRVHVEAHDVQGDQPEAALEAIFAEWPNLLRALDAAVGTERAADGLRLTIALDDPWMFRGIHQQARRHYAALVDAPDVSDAERARALSNYAYSCTVTAEQDLAMELLDRAAQFADRAGDRELQMRVLFHRAVALLEDGRPGQALVPLQQGRAIAADLGRDRSVGAFDDAMATALLYSGRAAEAAAQYRRANDADRRAAHTHGLVRGLVNEASAWLALGEVAAALRCAGEGVAMAHALGDETAEASLRAVHGHAALARGDLSGAPEHFRAALDAMPGDEVHVQLCRLDLADALLQADRIAEAAAIVDDVAERAAHQGILWLVSLPTRAELAAARGNAAAAAELVRVADAEYSERGFALPPALLRLERVRAGLAAASRTAPL